MIKSFSIRHDGHYHYGSRKAQQGAALIVALILLIVITLVGLAAIGTTLLQNKMASNQYDRQIAFQSTEAALRYASQWIQNNPSTAHAIDCSTGTTICEGNPFTDPNVASSNYQSVPATAFKGVLSAGQPQFVVEYMGEQSSALNANSANCLQAGAKLTCGSTTYSLFRITARSGDPATVGDRSVVTLQAVMKQG